jgi:hypothetical protein
MRYIYKLNCKGKSITTVKYNKLKSRNLGKIECVEFFHPKKGLKLLSVITGIIGNEV